MKKWLVIIGLLLAIVLCHMCAAEDRQLAAGSYQPVKKLTFREMVGRRLRDVWSWVTGNGDTFMGRCIGVARKLKIIMPMMVFKMGVIVTILIFLTIFSMKSLGLLITLLFINAAGIFGKWAIKEHDTKPVPPPQSVHLHVHPDKIGHTHYGYSKPSHGYYSHDPWDRSVSPSSRDEINLEDRLTLLRLYNRLGPSQGYSEYDTNIR